MREFWKRLFRSKPSVLRDLLPEQFYDYIEQNHVHPGYETVELRLPNGHLVQVTYRMGIAENASFSVTLGSWRYKAFPQPVASAIETQMEAKNSLYLSAVEWVELLRQVAAMPGRENQLAMG
ncbi:hypothetical protein GTO89_02550 [Heliobacterium gestii]|uniref:Uncharacterized protein n=1 Tax=Heliomicrobium gestii TaxID=2699 RepID=A0A845LEE6_HELGE|nr:hypothetical protein [Heliomicrobium gestii]MBM7865663.1 hypothetical protein [Heliomicrobium gestii]MZP41913.1 hypothetical protein [Heliomicrobium gestii]